MTDEELNEAARLVGSLSRETPQRAGRLIAELRRRSVSWSRIVEITGIPQTTAFAWAERHGRLRPHEADEH
ncbi:MAG TPA: hypothetical protein VD813_00705 [Pseudonocardia sp.]|nr:hypothetical protein [Pseudonocardia sp.]